MRARRRGGDQAVFELQTNSWLVDGNGRRLRHVDLPFSRGAATFAISGCCTTFKTWSSAGEGRVDGTTMSTGFPRGAVYVVSCVASCIFGHMPLVLCCFPPASSRSRWRDEVSMCAMEG